MGTATHRISRVASSVSASAKTALTLLLEAHFYANDVGVDDWEFAVEVQRLRDAGVTNSDLRWLICKRYANHGIETTLINQDERSFQQTGNLFISGDTCFVLTADGDALPVGFADNLIVGAFMETQGQQQSGQKPKKKRRYFLGVLPAISFEIVQR